MPPANEPFVIVADDDVDDLFFAQRSLRETGIGMNVQTCADGNEVVALLESMAARKAPGPRMIFLDVKMPHLNGFDTLKWIRAHKRYGATPVVMLSGSKEARDVELAKTLGANDYLVKYPDAEEFLRVLSSA